MTTYDTYCYAGLAFSTSLYLIPSFMDNWLAVTFASSCLTIGLRFSGSWVIAPFIVICYSYTRYIHRKSPHAWVVQ
jgi:hypothetical protein